MHRSFPRFVKISACLALFALAACASNGPELVPTPKVARVDYRNSSYTVTFEHNRAELSRASQTGLMTFLHSMSASNVSAATISAKTNQELNRKRAGKLRAILLHEGVNANVIRLQNARNSEPDTLTLTLEYALAIGPQPCPDWSRNPVTNYHNYPHSNYGCAMHNNIIQQLATPSDYDRGHGSSTMDAERTSVAIQKYRAGAQAAATSSGSSSASAASGSSSSP